MFKRIAVTAGLLLTLGYVEAYGQQTSSNTEGIGVDVMHTGTDRVGKMFVAALRDAIAVSPRYKLDSTSVLEIQIVSVEENRTNPGISSALAIAFTLYRGEGERLHLSLRVYSIGRDRVDTMARSLLADLDSELNK